jgi:hypothetical protein
MARTLAQRRASEAAEAAAREAAIEAGTLTDEEAREELLRREQLFIAETDTDSLLHAVGRDILMNALKVSLGAPNSPPTESGAVIRKKAIAEIERANGPDSFLNRTFEEPEGPSDWEPQSEPDDYIIPDPEDEEIRLWQEKQAKLRAKAPVGPAPGRKMSTQKAATQLDREGSKRMTGKSTGGKRSKASRHNTHSPPKASNSTQWSLIVKLPVSLPPREDSEAPQFPKTRSNRNRSDNPTSPGEQPQNFAVSNEQRDNNTMNSALEIAQHPLEPRVCKENEKLKLMRQNELDAKKIQAAREEAPQEKPAKETPAKEKHIKEASFGQVKHNGRLYKFQHVGGESVIEDTTPRRSLIVKLKVPSIYKPASQPGPFTPSDHRQMSGPAKAGITLVGKKGKKRARSSQAHVELERPRKDKRGRYTSRLQTSMNLRGGGNARVSSPQIAEATSDHEAQGLVSAAIGLEETNTVPPLTAAEELDDQMPDHDQDAADEEPDHQLQDHDQDAAAEEADHQLPDHDQDAAAEVPDHELPDHDQILATEHQLSDNEQEQEQEQDSDSPPPTAPSAPTLPLRIPSKRATRSSNTTLPSAPKPSTPTPAATAKPIPPRRTKRIKITDHTFKTPKQKDRAPTTSSSSSYPIAVKHQNHVTSTPYSSSISRTGIPTSLSARSYSATPIPIPDPPNVPTMPAIPVQKNRKALEDWKTGVMIALENVVEVRSPHPLLPPLSVQSSGHALLSSLSLSLISSHEHIYFF